LILVLSTKIKHELYLRIEGDKKKLIGNSVVNPHLVNLLNVCPSLSPSPMIKQQKNWSVVIARPDRILGQLLTKEGNLFPIRPGRDYQLISSHNDKVIV
jgi:hypothetical protein